MSNLQIIYLVVIEIIITKKAINFNSSVGQNTEVW